MNRHLTEEEFDKVVAVGLRKVYPGRYITWRATAVHPDGRTVVLTIPEDQPEPRITLFVCTNENNTAYLSEGEKK